MASRKVTPLGAWHFANWLINQSKKMIFLGLCGTIIFGYIFFSCPNLLSCILTVFSFSLIESGIIAWLLGL